MSENPRQGSTPATQAVEVSRTLPTPLTDVWDVLVSRPGAEALLGPGADFGTKGQSWHTDDGAFGVVRSFHPQEQIRVSWHETPDSPRSLVDLRVAADGEGTRLDLSHDPVPDDPDADRARWEHAIDRLSALLQD